MQAQQRGTPGFGLDSIIVNVGRTLAFIEADFFDFEVDSFELMQTGHPLFLHKVNKALTFKPGGTSLFGLPVGEVYAYRKDERQYALYILLEYNPDAVGSIIKGLRKPDNVTEDDLGTGDYDFLAWHLSEGIDIFLNTVQSHAARTSDQQTILLSISNIPLKESINWEKPAF